MEAKLRDLEVRMGGLECNDGLNGGGTDEGRKAVAQKTRALSDMQQIMKKVSSRLDDFEHQINGKLSKMQSDVDKKLSQVNRNSSAKRQNASRSISPTSDASPETVEQLGQAVGELTDMINTNKGEMSQIRRVVLNCERDMEDFTSAMESVNVDLDEMRAKHDGLEKIVNSKQRVEATMSTELSSVKLVVGDMQENLKNHDHWMEEVTSTLQNLQEKEEGLVEDIAELKSSNSAGEDTNSAIKLVNDSVAGLRSDVEEHRHKFDSILEKVRHDITTVESGIEELSTSATRPAKTDIDMKQTKADVDTVKQMKMDMASVMQQVDLSKQETSRRLGALDLRMSGVQGGLGEHKRDLLKLREDISQLTAKHAAHEVEIQKNGELAGKFDKQLSTDGRNWKTQMDAVTKVLDKKASIKSVEHLKQNVESLTSNLNTVEHLKENVEALTKGTVKFAQVVGVFPAQPDNRELGDDWEEMAAHLEIKVDEAWRKRCTQPQRFKTILDMVGKKADNSVLRLIQISQQHLETHMERAKHERNLWKEILGGTPRHTAMASGCGDGDMACLPAPPETVDM